MNRFITAGACALLLCGSQFRAVAKEDPAALGRPRRGQAEAPRCRLPDARRGFPAVQETDDRSGRGRVPEGLGEGLQPRCGDAVAAHHAGGRRARSRPLRARISPRSSTRLQAKAGLEIVTAPGADVLRVRPGVIDLYITAPDTMSAGMSRTYTMESGQATLFIEVRDSTTGALLGRALDKRATRNTGRVQISNSVTNLADFKALFKQWADISVKGFKTCARCRPCPTDLKPGQKLQQ